MNDITGDKQFVLKLLKDTARNLAVRHPGQKSPAKKKAVKQISGVQQIERDQIIERFQRAYEMAQLEPVVAEATTGKKGLKRKGVKEKASAAPTGPHHVQIGPI